jgi:hypothetical protein
MTRYFPLFPLCLLLLNCTTDKSLPSGYDLLERDFKGEVRILDIRPSETAIYRQTAPAGRRATLLLGNNGGVHSFFLIRFFDLSAIDTATVESASIVLNQVHQYGDGEEVSVAVYPMTDSWVEYSVIWEDVESLYEATREVGAFKIGVRDTTAFDSVQIKVDIDPEIVNEWIRSQEANNGLLFMAGAGDYMAGYYSSEATSKWANMIIVHTNKEGNTDTTTVATYLNDTSLLFYDDIQPAENELIRNPENLIVSNSTNYMTLLRFDFSQLPRDITLHQAYLQLYIDHENSEFYDRAIPISAKVVLTDSIWTPVSMRYDSLTTPPTAYVSSEGVTFAYTSTSDVNSLTTTVQAWHYDVLPNYGLVLQAAEAGGNMADVAFFSGNSDTTRAPVMRLTYSLPPNPRF